VSADELPTRDVFWRMANAYQASHAIHVAATLGIADLLEAGPMAPRSLLSPRIRTLGASTGCCAPFPVWGCSPRGPTVASA
jgi:hypothetical protein